jgi:hypothetical protein
MMYVAYLIFFRNNSYLWPEATQGSHLWAKKLSLSLSDKEQPELKNKQVITEPKAA